MGYDNFETRTVRHRMQKARTRYWQLQKMLSTRRGMNVAQRIQMWETTIRPTLLYGLECIPLSPVLKHAITSFAMRHIRAITANQSHITHTSDAELLNQFRLCSMSDCLLNAFKSNISSLEQYTVSNLVAWGRKCLETFQAACVNMAAVQRQFDPHACPVCGVYFDSRRAVKVHIARVHSSMTAEPVPEDEVEPSVHPVEDASGPVPSSSGEKPQQDRRVAATTSCRPVIGVDLSPHVATTPGTLVPAQDAVAVSPSPANSLPDALVPGGMPSIGLPVVFCKATHSRNGLPACAACHKNFGRWSGLRKHITKGYCSVLFSMQPGKTTICAPDFVPIVRRPDIVQRMRSRGLSGILHNPGVLAEMKQRCVLCHQWVASSWMMKNHFRNSHADFWLKNHAHCDKYCKEQGVCALQCHYCGKQTVELT